MTPHTQGSNPASSKTKFNSCNARLLLIGLGLLWLCGSAALADEADKQNTKNDTLQQQTDMTEPEAEKIDPEKLGSNPPRFERFISPGIDTNLDLGLCDGS